MYIYIYIYIYYILYIYIYLLRRYVLLAEELNAQSRGPLEGQKIQIWCFILPGSARLGSVRFGLLGSAVPGSAQLDSPWLHLGWRDSAYPGLVWLGL